MKLPLQSLPNKGFAENKTRYRWYSKYVRSLFVRSYFYKMEVVVNFLRWGGSAPRKTGKSTR